MKKIFVLIVCLALYTLCIPSFGMTDNAVTGVIIETSENNEFIQVDDSIYQVHTVWLENGVDKEKKINRRLLTIGSLVQVYLGQQTVDYWQTEKVVLLVGKKEADIARQFDLVSEQEQLRNLSVSDVGKRSLKKQQKSSQSVFLEDGVWKN